MNRFLLSFLLLVLPALLFAQPPAGYYNAAAGQTCSGLKTALYNIISASHNPKSYNALSSQYPLSDVKPREVGTGSAMVIYDVYSDRPLAADPYNFTPNTDQCGNYNSEGDCYNREHTFPGSWFDDESPAYSDYHHVYPTDGYVNNIRSNYRLGEVGTANFTSLNGSKRGSSSFAGITGTVFEPIDSFKGDLARAYFYMVTRYQNRLATWNGYSTDGALTLTGNTYPAVEIPYLRMMLKWHNMDPVSQKEITRNNGGYSFQSNRNPFVDHPEYVNLIWNATCPGLAALPVDIISFTGKLDGSRVVLNWEVANEMNLSSYEVERSFNGAEYNYIGSIAAANLSQYTFTDNVSFLGGSRVYYRLKRVDKDGSFQYSEVVSLHLPLNVKFSLYPNPAKDEVRLNINNNSNALAEVRISNITGAVVLTMTAQASNGLLKVNISTLPAGTYFVTLHMGDEQWMQKLLIVK